MRTQVGIVGAGPAGLLLSHLLAQRGIDSVVVETRSREYCEARQRAGVLEDGSVRLLREAGLAGRLDRQGLEHGGIYLQFAGGRHHIDFRDLTGGRTVTVYAQTEVVKDLIAQRLADGAAVHFDACATEVGDLTGDQPVLRFTDAEAGGMSCAATRSPDATGSTASAVRRSRPGCWPLPNGATRTPGSGSWPTCHRPPTS